MSHFEHVALGPVGAGAAEAMGLPSHGGPLLASVSTSPLIWLGVLGLALLAASLWNRRGSSTAGRSRIRLTAQHELHVVELEGRRLVIATGPASAPSLVCELDAAHRDAAEGKGATPGSSLAVVRALSVGGP